MVSNPVVIKLLGYLAAGITVWSVWLTGNKSIWVWYLSGINQFIWGYIGFVTGQYYLCVMAVLLQALNVRGYRKWKKERRVVL